MVRAATEVEKAEETTTANAGTTTEEGRIPGVPPNTEYESTIKLKGKTASTPTPQATPFRAPVPFTDTSNLPRPTTRPPSLTEFLYFYKEAPGVEEWQMLVERLQDSPRDTFVRHAANTELLGMFKFNTNPAEFIKDLQHVNGNSGGTFRIQLYDDTGDIVEDERFDGVWKGTIANPLDTEKKAETPAQTPAATTEKKQPTLLEQLREQNTLKEEMDKFLGKGEGTGDGNSIDRIIEQAQVMPTLVSTMATSMAAMVEVMKNAREQSGSNEEPSIKARIVDKVLGDEGIQDRAVGLVTNIVDGIAGIFTGRRAEKNDKAPAATDKVATKTTAPAKKEKPEKVDVLSYLLERLQANEAVNVKTDETLLALKKQSYITYSALKGALATRSVEQVKERVMELARDAGREEEMRAALQLPHATDFILNLKATAK